MPADEQLALLGPPPAAARTWADVRPGQRITCQVPGSEWNGTWTVRRTQPHPYAPYLLTIDLTSGDGRTWTTWIAHRVAFPGPGFTEATTRKDTTDAR